MKKRIISRYKICFQTRNKVWIYKNSRLRNFYNIRHKIILKQSLITKLGKLALKNMKWTVARRQMVPYTRQKFYTTYKNFFFLKQRLKWFYGKLKEYKIRNFFKQTWNKARFKKQFIFNAALEQRVNILFFRMRLLPTIFACTHFIMRHGIYVNDNLIKAPNFRINVGDILSLSEDKWKLFYLYIFKKIKVRFYGWSIFFWRRYSIYSKLQYNRIKNKQFYINNFFLIEKSEKLKIKILNLLKHGIFLIKFYKNILKIDLDLNENFKQIIVKLKNKFIKMFLYFYKNIKISYIFIKKNLKKLHRWSKLFYKKLVINMYRHLFNIRILSYTFRNILAKLSFFEIFLYKKSIENFNFKNEINLLSIYKKDFIINDLKKKNYYQKKINVKKIKLKKNFTDIFYDNNWEMYFKYINQIFDGYSKDYVENNFKFILFTFYKKSKNLRKFYLKNKKLRYIFYLIKKLKFKQRRKNTFLHWSNKIHFFIPLYLEMDFKTLRACLIDYPKNDEIIYNFSCSPLKMVSFFKERSL